MVAVVSRVPLLTAAGAVVAVMTATNALDWFQNKEGLGGLSAKEALEKIGLN